MNERLASPVGAAVAAAEHLLHQLLALSVDAHAALDADDADALLAVLEARDEAIRRDGAALETLVSLRRDLAGGHRRGREVAEFELRCAELDRVAAEIQESDGRLEARIGASRDRIEAELGRASLGAAAAAAYRREGDPQIDFRG